MPLTTTVQIDGPRHYVVTLAASAGDPATIDISAFAEPCDRVRVDQVKYSTDGDITLAWNGTADPFLILDAAQDNFDWRDAGGIPNKTGTGNGDIDIVKVGASGTYFMTLYLTKIFD